MGIHIGLMIWKEMKQKNIAVSDLAGSLAMSKTKAQEILNSATIDTLTLVNVCEILDYNFFRYYENSTTFSRIDSQEKQFLKTEIERLKALLLEKNKVIELMEKLAKTQTNSISILEKGQYR